MCVCVGGVGLGGGGVNFESNYCDIIYEWPFRTHSHLIWLLADVIWQQVMTLSLNNLSSISLLLPTPHMLGGAHSLKPVHSCNFD